MGMCVCACMHRDLLITGCDLRSLYIPVPMSLRSEFNHQKS